MLHIVKSNFLKLYFLIKVFISNYKLYFLKLFNYTLNAITNC